MHPDLAPLKGLQHDKKLRQLVQLGLLPLHRNMDVCNPLPRDQLGLSGQSIGCARLITAPMPSAGSLAMSLSDSWPEVHSQLNT